jgi:hypothetical protein
MTTTTTRSSRWSARVEAGDWDRALYDRDESFRSTINMGRHRFGQGEYRYFARPFPEVIRSGRRYTLALVFHDAA